MALYNTERPKDFSAILGQPSLVKRFKGMLKSPLPNAMIFAGERGTGKTSSARIFAKAVNCESPNENGPCCSCESCRAADAGNNMNIVELDGASNNGVDSVEALIEQTQYRFEGAKKVFVIDEAHMLTKAAWNAFLKTVEEPPEGCVFIFCTTESEKIPTTIRSRSRVFSFKPISSDVIAEKLRSECEKYGKVIEDDALNIIARAAGGAMRDGESLLESFFYIDGTITADIVAATLGEPDEDTLYGIMSGVLKGNTSELLDKIRGAVADGRTPQNLTAGLIEMSKDIVYVSEGGNASKIGRSQTYIEKVKELSEIAAVGKAFDVIKELSSARIGSSAQLLESVLVSLCRKKVESAVIPTTVVRDDDSEIIALRKELDAITSLLKYGDIPLEWQDEENNLTATAEGTTVEEPKSEETGDTVTGETVEDNTDYVDITTEEDLLMAIALEEYDDSYEEPMPEPEDVGETKEPEKADEKPEIKSEGFDDAEDEDIPFDEFLPEGASIGAEVELDAKNVKEEKPEEKDEEDVTKNEAFNSLFSDFGFNF